MTVKTIMQIGDLLHIVNTDGTKQSAFAALPLWLVSVPAVVEPDPGTGNGTIYNPWAGRSQGYEWESHRTYSAGGSDYPCYNENLPAPASGVLHTSGGSGEFAAGNIGSAGLRSVLYLDTPVARTIAKSTTLMNGSTYEADGPMTHIVFQHQSSMGVHMQHYNQTEIVGVSGNTGGADYHLHIHGLQANGARVDFDKFI